MRIINIDQTIAEIPIIILSAESCLSMPVPTNATLETDNDSGIARYQCVTGMAFQGLFLYKDFDCFCSAWSDPEEFIQENNLTCESKTMLSKQNDQALF